MLERATHPIDHLMLDLRTVMADAEALLTATAGQVGDGAVEARDRIQARMEQARSTMARLQDGTIARAKAAGHVADDYVHHNPWRTIGAAAGIGLLLGMLVGRR